MTPTSSTRQRPTDAEVATRLRDIDQGHLIQHADSLTRPQRAAMFEQLRELDLDALPSLIREYVLNKPAVTLPADLEPVDFYPRDHTSRRRSWDRAAYRTAGEALIRAGKVAAFTVAGGQGSRLGYDGPKGCYPATAITRKPLFQVFAEGLLATQRRYGRAIPWYIMTSPLNHDATIAFFEQHSHFGLSPRDIAFFQQGSMPSFDMATGRILLADRGQIATNPDGHGGAIRALHVSGSLDDMRERGVEHLSYFQVDNPIVRVVDPVFIGLHATAPDSSCEMSSKMVSKAGPDERVGVFCASGGRTMVVEYSDLPRSLANERLADGTLRFAAGSIAIHIMSVEFLSRLATDPASSLPYHRAEKVVEVFDPAASCKQRPEKPNAVKLERFIFDALPLCRSSIVLETDRIEEFAPIKNAEGVDSPATSTAIQTERAARWLEAVGVKIPRDAQGRAECVIEVSPLTALEGGDVRGAKLPGLIKREAVVVL